MSADIYPNCVHAYLIRPNGNCYNRYNSEQLSTREALVKPIKVITYKYIKQFLMKIKQGTYEKKYKNSSVIHRNSPFPFF